MNIIELEHWAPDPERPHRLKYAGQPAAQEVFEELRYRLESMGYLPDEYFILDNEWENGREIPRDADIFCTTDYGASEGIYLEVYLKWHDDGKPVTKSFMGSGPNVAAIPRSNTSTSISRARTGSLRVTSKPVSIALTTTS